MEKMSILLWIGSSKKSGKIKWLCRFHYLDPSYSSRWLSVGADSEFSGQNAYDILGVSESSSLSEIKASFHKLAKQTHPDLSHSHSNQRFVAILAAYQILSDSERRAHYDRYLLSQRKVLHKHSTQGSMRYVYKTHDITSTKQMEVVEWLRWYRMAVKEILAENKLATGNSYFDVLEADFYAAIHTAYYGPTIESMDSLPDCFEAEVRSVYETPEVLHLVSGRDLFGMVCLADKTPKLSSPSTLKLKSFETFGLGLCPSKENVGISIWSNMVKGIGLSERLSGNDGIHSSDAYNDLELHLYGKLVAIATRSRPLNSHNGFPNEGTEDRIKVFLSSEDNSVHIHQGVPNDSTKGRAKTPVATILGLGTTPEEGQCFVYDGNGSKTHLIMKHRTLMVKHMHWYEVTDKVSVCECRCTRARLPPSRFWLFEPRCGMHDIGGWYVETFGKDKKRRTVPSQRFWDGFDGSELYDKRLHPAAYLLALAYRTLDLEDAKRRKRTMKSFVEVQLSRIFHWCKKLV